MAWTQDNVGLDSSLTEDVVVNGSLIVDDIKINSNGIQNVLDGNPALIISPGGITSTVPLAVSGNATVGGTLYSTFEGPLTGNVTGNVSGNAGTVTNGLYNTGNQTLDGILTATGFEPSSVATYTITGAGVATRSLNIENATLSNVRLVLCTLLSDLKNIGLID